MGFFAVVAVVVRVDLGWALILSEVASASASWSAALSSVAFVVVLVGLRAAGVARVRIVAVVLLEDAMGMVVVTVER